MSVTATFRQDTSLWSSLERLKEINETSPLPPGTQPTSPIALRVPIAVSGQPLFSTTVQINSPYRIESAFLQPFLDQQKKILLVPSGIGKMSASLSAIHESYLIAATNQTERFLGHGSSIVLVVFPVLPERSYVLQTRIRKIYIDRVNLEYQDPRYEPRRQFLSLAPITLRLIPPDIVTAMKQKQLHLTREIGWLTRETEGRKEGYLTDLLYEKTFTSPASPEPFKELLPFPCRLNNISCGGISVSMAGEQPQEGLSQRVVLLHIPLPPVIVDSGKESVALTLKLLGIMRAIRSVPPSVVLHIQFLERLPEEFDALFERMEREAVTTNISQRMVSPDHRNGVQE